MNHEQVMYVHDTLEECVADNGHVAVVLAVSRDGLTAVIMSYGAGDFATPPLRRVLVDTLRLGPRTHYYVAHPLNAPSCVDRWHDPKVETIAERLGYTACPTCGFNYQHFPQQP